MFNRNNFEPNFCTLKCRYLYRQANYHNTSFRIFGAKLKLHVDLLKSDLILERSLNWCLKKICKWIKPINFGQLLNLMTQSHFWTIFPTELEASSWANKLNRKCYQKHNKTRENDIISTFANNIILTSFIMLLVTFLTFKFFPYSRWFVAISLRFFIHILL